MYNPASDKGSHVYAKEMESKRRHSYSRATTHECVHGALLVKNWSGVGSEEKQEQTEVSRGPPEQKKEPLVPRGHPQLLPL